MICVAEGLTICNGPAFDEPRGRLYLADTAVSIVDVFDLDPATGAIGRRRRFLDFGDAQVWPDGMTVDDEGMLWVALGRAGPFTATAPTGRSMAWSRYPRRTRPRWPSAALTAVTCTSPRHGST